MQFGNGRPPSRAMSVQMELARGCSSPEAGGQSHEHDPSTVALLMRLGALLETVQVLEVQIQEREQRMHVIQESLTPIQARVTAMLASTHARGQREQLERRMKWCEIRLKTMLDGVESNHAKTRDLQESVYTLQERMHRFGGNSIGDVFGPSAFTTAAGDYGDSVERIFCVSLSL